MSGYSVDVDPSVRNVLCTDKNLHVVYLQQSKLVNHLLNMSRNYTLVTGQGIETLSGERNLTGS